MNLILKIKRKINKYTIEILIIDNYNFNLRLQKQIKENVNKLIIIDDYFDKKYFCDLLLNYSFLNKKEKSIIKKNNPKTNFALGPKYLPLNSIFFELKKKVKLRKEIRKILIFFGGSDNRNITEKLLVVSKYFKHLQFSVVVGGLNKNKKKITKKIKNYKNIKLYYAIKNENVANLIYNNDLAIGAGGVNLFERIYLGLPSIVIDVNKNQNMNIKNSVKRGLVAHLSIKKLTVIKLVKMIETFLKNKSKFNKMSNKCFTYLQLNQIKNINKLLY